jgi:hypothetical protein
VVRNVPWLCHPPSGSQTDRGETHPLIEPGEKERKSTSERKSEIDIVVPRVLLTDVLIPYPLFPALAIGRRYFLLRQTGYVKRTQTIKCNRHSGGEKKNTWS